MNSLFQSKKRFFSILFLLLLAIGIPLGVYLSQQSQDLRQQAAGGKSDLEVRMLRLTDAAGNVRTTFYENEDIYVSLIVRNSGTQQAKSTDGITTSQVFSNRGSAVAFQSVSDVDITLKNGQFGAGQQSRYDSRLNGEGQANYTKTPYVDGATAKYSWRRAEAGNFTARVFLNSNKHVTEDNYDNNQATLAYKVIRYNEADEVGTVESNQPPNFTKWPCPVTNAINFPGVSGCIQQVKDSSGTVWGKITNNSGSTISVALASYKEYHPWLRNTCSQLNCPEKYIQTWTQIFYKAKETQIANGVTRFISTEVPKCAWQADLFINGIPFSFHPNRNTYRGIRYVAGWYHFYPTYNVSSPKLCDVDNPPLPSMTPTPKVGTPTPTGRPSPTPTIPEPTEVPTPTLPPGVTPTATPTPTIPACPVPAKVENVRVICPYCAVSSSIEPTLTPIPTEGNI